MGTKKRGRGSRARGASARPGPGTGARRRGGGRGPAAPRRGVAILSVLTVLGLGYVLLFTPTLGVRSVKVAGAHGAAAERIRAVAAVPPERPMLRVDTDGIADRVTALPGIAEATATRSWPSTITITVRRRVAVAYHRNGETLSLVDTGGTVFKRVGEPPALPRLEVPEPGPSDSRTRAVTTVLGSLPSDLAERVAVARAPTPGNVELVLRDDTTVRWGNARQNTFKARVLAVLLTREGSTYDVSSPELPTVS